MSASPPRGMTTSQADGIGDDRGQLLARGLERHDGVLGQAGGLEAVAHAAQQRGVGGARARRAAQQAGVAALEAQARDVDRHVRARLVDDQEHAERHAHLLHVEAVGQPPARDDLAHGIVQRGHGAHRLAEREHALAVERQPVEQRARLTGGARGGEILGVGLDDRGRVALDRERDLLERRILGAAAERRQRARGGAGAGARRVSRHCHRAEPGYRDEWPRGPRRRPSAGPAARRSSALPMATTPVANTSPSSVHTRTASPARNASLHALDARPAAGSRRARAAPCARRRPRTRARRAACRSAATASRPRPAGGPR